LNEQEIRTILAVKKGFLNSEKAEFKKAIDSRVAGATMKSFDNADRVWTEIQLLKRILGDE